MTGQPSLDLGRGAVEVFGREGAGHAQGDDVIRCWQDPDYKRFLYNAA